MCSQRKMKSLSRRKHEGSGKMEVDGVVEIFQRSQALHGAGVRYANYIKDGDSKTFKTVLERQLEWHWVFNKQIGVCFI